MENIFSLQKKHSTELERKEVLKEIKMHIWAIADVHLALSTPSKSMEAFGPLWKDYHEKIRKNWIKHVAPQDLVLIAGDISWAKKFSDALIDLSYLDTLPGTKVIIKGNHDYWWPSMKKLTEQLPPSIIAIYNNAIKIGSVAIAGSRLWDTQEYTFDPYIDLQPKRLNSSSMKIASPSMVSLKNGRHFSSHGTFSEKTPSQEDEKIYLHELERLEKSLSQMPNAPLRIVMTHYPPIGADLKPSRASSLLEKYNIHFAVFGHLHSLKPDLSLFGEKNRISYLLTSCDAIGFSPLWICKQPSS